jgi:hypothetical protein
MCDGSFGFLWVVDLVDDGVEELFVDVVGELFEVVVAKMWLFGPVGSGVEDFRAEFLEVHVELGRKSMKT